jgi:hypothetical protein
VAKHKPRASGAHALRAVLLLVKPQLRGAIFDRIMNLALVDRFVIATFELCCVPLDLHISA